MIQNLENYLSIWSIALLSVRSGSSGLRRKSIALERKSVLRSTKKKYDRIHTPECHCMFRHLVQKTLGREFRFDSFFMDLQTGNLFRNVSLGPFVKRGLPTNRVETKHIIKNYISLINPRLPLLLQN